MFLRLYIIGKDRMNEPDWTAQRNINRSLTPQEINISTRFIVGTV